MKFLTLMFFFVAYSGTSHAQEFRAITLKTAVSLDDSQDGFPGSYHLCFDLEAGETVQTTECRERPDRTKRLCSLLIYNLAAANPVKQVRAGTTFLTHRQFGPEIQSDWDRRISLLKIFANRSGQAEDFGSPHLIIECRQSFDDYRHPALFGWNEVSALMGAYIQIDP